MTVLSLNARSQMTAEHRDGVPIWLFTFTHPALEAPIRLSSDPTRRLSIDPYLLGTLSRGMQFLWVPGDLTLPADDEDAPPQIRLIVDALDRTIFDVIRASRAPAAAKIEHVWSFSPNLVEMTLDHLEVTSAPYDETQVTINLSQESFWGEGWPSGRFTPTWFPGLHR